MKIVSETITRITTTINMRELKELVGEILGGEIRKGIRKRKALGGEILTKIIELIEN